MSAEDAYMMERGGVFCQAIGLARLALVSGEPEKALRYLDDACDETHELHWAACLADGYEPALVEQFLGPRVVPPSPEQEQQP